MSTSVDILQIFKLLPHRYPFILVDKVEDYKVNTYVRAIKNVTINEPYFMGHFPGNPIMPGVLIIEAMAQAGGILYNLSIPPREDDKEFVYLFAGIDNAKFKQVVVPGDSLRIEVTVLSRKRGFWRMHGEAYVGDKLACSADLMTVAKEIEK